ncbi:hypothetical protein [Stackebrandtia nassauensis]|uniref:Uncharacterized protein n=1 Tax=Stackebrandtia nassauensis (strain DSM 44728 / CIP 108903 / NRRL B-16338 / NBRC 102104 / LLR-40K-21) TaxID=446470 RepID=D3Q2F4_STANL|nr:hypothetical protein [Stackebrandtia nassauensis]ADD43887.1 hypothetical protein Snas_4238 [Stackebrandtia nassauensis DSM 44728]
MPNVKQIWRTKGMIDAPTGDETLSPAKALTAIMADVETLPDDVEVLKADQSAIRTEIASLAQSLADTLAPALLAALAEALKTGITDDVLVSAAEQGVRRVLGSLDPEPGLIAPTPSAPTPPSRDQGVKPTVTRL